MTPPIAPATIALPDPELLQQFAKNEDQAAFTELVARHVNLVYSTAIRRLSGDAHLAQDVTQSVFTDLARKARALENHRVISSWLYTSTCFTAAKAVRTEQRRRKRESEAYIMHDLLNCPGTDSEWSRLRPILDQAMQELKTQDREALLLRFFEAKNFSEIGACLRLTENAARMRVDRALEKLRVRLAPFGISSTATALGSTLALHAVSAAPAGLASVVTIAAVSSAAATGGLSILQWLTLNKVVIVSSAALLAVTSTGLQRERREQVRLQAERAVFAQQLSHEAPLRSEVDALTQRATEIATLRLDDAELERLKTEAAVLHTLLQSGVTNPSTTTIARKPPTTLHTVLDLKELDQKPTLKSQPRPKYPIELKLAGVSGKATVSFIVDSEGTVREVKVIEATHKNFENAASQAVQTWTFTPGIKEGKPVSARMVVPMVFSLSETDHAWF